MIAPDRFLQQFHVCSLHRESAENVQFFQERGHIFERIMGDVFLT
jgi:hypothetical protein